MPRVSLPSSSSSSSLTMTATVVPPDSGDTFLSHLVALLSIYELGPSPAPIPQYNAKTDWQMDSILRSLTLMAQRMYAAEHKVAAINESHRWQADQNGERATSDIIRRTSSSGSSMYETVLSSSFHASDSPDTSTTDFDFVDSNDGITPAAERVPMSISLDGLPPSIDAKIFSKNNKKRSIATSAPPSSHLDHSHCPTCGKVVADTITMSKITASLGSSQAGSPLVVPPGPLATAAFESGMSAIEELRLLKAQVQDVARVCNAVARGDLSQKITVPVQGVVMVQLKDVINTMVRSSTFFSFIIHCNMFHPPPGR